MKYVIIYFDINIIGFKIKVKGTEINSEPCERTNVDNGSTTPPLASSITQNVVDPSTTNNITDRSSPTPTIAETNNTQELSKGNNYI